MDIEQLAKQLPRDGRRPGVALLVARDVIESAVLAGGLAGHAVTSLRAAGNHLNQARGTYPDLESYAWLGTELIRIADHGRLPGDGRLEPIRAALRDLVRIVPPEGSVSPDVEYAGF